jgi:O-antigen/teichoic acid export membrane protein
MREHLANAAWGILDYAAYPMGMLLVAPVILRNMGAAQYGIWTVATAIISIGSIVAAGFGDANIQHVASHRGAGRSDLLLRTVRCMIGINLLLGAALAAIAWASIPYVARHLALSPAVQRDCMLSLRLACILICIRTMESVCISTQRGFERYGAAVRISLTARLLSLAAAAALTYQSHRVATLIAATLACNAAATWLQFKQLHKLVPSKALTPLFDNHTLNELLRFGAFSWLQAVAAILFGQVDRLYLGVSYGAVAVSSYALCVQMAQPAYGIAASGLHFIFPYLAERRASRAPAGLRRSVFTAFAGNLLIVAAVSAVLILFGPGILHALAGKEIAKRSFGVLPIIVMGSALVGLNVTATYSLLALGRVRIVGWSNLGAIAAMLLLMSYLGPHHGAYGLAFARLSYGGIMLLLYVPLIRNLSNGPAPLSIVAAQPVCEEM